MQIALFPFFLLQLIFLNTIFLSKVFFTKFSHTKSGLKLLILILIVGLAFAKNTPLKNLNSIIKLPQLKNHTAINTTRFALNKNPYTSLPINLKAQKTQVIEVSPENIQKNLNLYRELYKKQPTHRDILINLSILEQISGNNKLANEYLDKARQLDPNNDLFKQQNSRGK